MSCSCVLEQIDRSRWDVLLVGITRQGLFYLYDGEISSIRSDTWQNDSAHLRRAVFAPEQSGGCLYTVDASGICLKRHTVDVILPMVHGAYCEDGRLQGYLDLCGIPYVGAGCGASAVCMDKVYTKRILQSCGVRQASYAVLTAAQVHRDLIQAVAFAKRVGVYPLFVKPANAGSSIGISKAKNDKELAQALQTAIKFDSKLLVEEAIVGKEVEVAVLDGTPPYAATPGEIVPGAEFYDYMDKYQNGKSQTLIPARVSARSIERLRERAVYIFGQLGCRGLARVDFFVSGTEEAEEIIFNEINTLPAFTSISMYPKMLMHDGHSYAGLIDTLLEQAITQNEREQG